jgi:hypothetical protein
MKTKMENGRRECRKIDQWCSSRLLATFWQLAETKWFPLVSTLAARGLERHIPAQHAREAAPWLALSAVYIFHEFVADS